MRYSDTGMEIQDQARGRTGAGPNQQQFLEIVRSFSGQANILTIPRIYIDIAGGLETALLLSQIIYWSDKGRGEDGWFFKTFTEWEEELGIKENKIRRSVKKLVDKGFVETRVKKAYGNPTVHYFLKTDVFLGTLTRFFTERKPSKLKKGNCQNDRNETVKMTETKLSNSQEPYTEITAQNTPETTEEKPKISAKDPNLIKERDTMSGNDGRDQVKETNHETLPDDTPPLNFKIDNPKVAPNYKPKKLVKDETIAHTVITELNQLLGTSFKPTTLSTLKHINARITEGFTVDDLLAVVRSRVDLWKDDPKMAPYLRPATLFNSEKFEGYLQVARKPPSEDEEFTVRLVAAMARKEAEERLAGEDNDANHG